MFRLSDILVRAVWLYGPQIAVRQGRHAMSYRQLGDRVVRLAERMHASGLQPGDRVAVLARNSFRNLEIHLACAHAGLILVPLNIRLAPAETKRILDLTESRLLFKALPFEGASIRTLEWDDDDGPEADNAYEAFLSRGSPIGAEPRAKSDIAQIYFTSGTTGEPKGACLTEQNLIASALDAVITLGLNAQSVWFHAPPMFHLVDAFAVWAVTMVGGCHVTEHFDPARFCEVVEQTGVTAVSLPPTLIDMIVRHPDFDRFDLSSLDRISYGGAPMPEPVYVRSAAAFPCPLVQSYGATETAGTVCQQVPEDVVGRPWTNSIGQPLPHIRIRNLDDAGNDVPPGEVGELAVGGERVMAGYWRNEAATRAAFRDGFYLTGDLAVHDEVGHFTILGRKKEMIISGGENVYPAEVEKALLSHASVAEAAVFGVPHPLWGEEVRAVVCLEGESEPSPQQLIDHCRTLIGGYKIPKLIEISREPLPKTGPGKIAKSLVRQRHLEHKTHAET
ncbi:MAG: AMP-binding protein [Pseudomonadota bacterium]